MAGPFCLFRLRPRRQRELATRTGNFKMAVLGTPGFCGYGAADTVSHRSQAQCLDHILDAEGGRRNEQLSGVEARARAE